MIPLTFKPIDQWPEGWQDPQRVRKPSPFRLGYTQTLGLLNKELTQLRAKSAQLQVDAASGQLRRDGQLRADARVDHPGVILTVDAPKHGVLIYPCDTFRGRYYADSPDWQINLLAIAKALEALRMIDRYGVNNGGGQQYAGFNALGAGTPVGAPETMGPVRAARVLAEAAGHEGTPSIEWVREHADQLYKTAAKTYHPDSGSPSADASVFGRITLARDVLKGGA